MTGAAKAPHAVPMERGAIKRKTASAGRASRSLVLRTLEINPTATLAAHLRHIHTHAHLSLKLGV